MLEDDLNRAITLSKEGKKVEARKIFESIVHDNPKNDRAWLWLSDTYTDNPNRIVVLEECLKYNSDNQQVQKWLATIKEAESKNVHTSSQETLKQAMELSKAGKKKEEENSRSFSDRLRKDFMVSTAFSYSFILILIVCVGFLFYKTIKLEKSLNETNNALSITMKKVADLQSEMVNVSSNIATTNYNLNATNTTLIYVQGIAENANKYAHCHPNLGIPCY
jgi:hypothetical protein